MITMIAASSNAHKIKEIQSIMSKFGVKVVSRKEAGVPEFEIEEDGETFEENSLKKALDYKEVPAANEIQCGNYKDLSLFGAKEYAKKALDKGFALNILPFCSYC